MLENIVFLEHDKCSFFFLVDFFYDKIKFYILSQNLHQTCSNDSRNDPSPKSEMVHETNFS